jgi:hypothetical protein
MDVFKLLVGMAALTVLSAALGLVSLEEYGLEGVARKIAPFVADIRVSIDYFSNEFLGDAKQLLSNLKGR